MPVGDQNTVNTNLCSNFGIMSGVADEKHAVPGNVKVTHKLKTDFRFSISIMIVKAADFCKVLVYSQFPGFRNQFIMLARGENVLQITCF